MPTIWPALRCRTACKIARPGECQRLDRKPGLAKVGSDLHGLELEARLEDLLELHAFRHGAVDENADQTIAPGSGDQAVGLHRGDVQARCDLALGEAAGVMQPGGARCQAGIVVKWLKRPVAAAHALPCNIFQNDKISHARRTVNRAMSILRRKNSQAA